jgi:hypothetical protein
MADDPDLRKEAKELWKAHLETGEPLDDHEVEIVVAAGLSKAEDWEMRGGGLYWHAPTWPNPDA